MKIHRFSRQLRRYWWSTIAVRTVDALLVPTIIIVAVFFGIDDLKAWLEG